MRGLHSDLGVLRHVCLQLLPKVGHVGGVVHQQDLLQEVLRGPEGTDIMFILPSLSPVENGVNSSEKHRPGLENISDQIVKNILKEKYLVVEADNDTCLGQYGQVSLSCFTVLIS